MPEERHVVPVRVVLGRESAAMATAAKSRDRFEALWARYVDALDRLDAAKAQINTLPSGTPSHAYRVARGTRKEARLLHARLVSEYDMDLGALP